MIYAHFSALESTILALAQVAANTGHSIHKGTAREWFLRDYLAAHLSERVAVGSGEVIDADSEPGDQRNQLDAVIYRRDFPKLAFGGGITGFLAESVLASIEVKSTLDAEDILNATKAAKRLKTLRRALIPGQMASGHTPLAILSYVVAYAGPAQLVTVQNWINDALTTAGIDNPFLPPTLQERVRTPSPALDGVFILGKGFLLYDNSPLSFIPESERLKSPQMRWVRLDTVDQNLMMLFLLLTVSGSGFSDAALDPSAYVRQLRSSGDAAWSI